MSRKERARKFNKAFKAQNTVVKELVRIDEITEEELNKCIDLYDVWQVGFSYKRGDIMQFGGKLYKAITDIVSMEHYPPTVATSNYSPIFPEDIIAEWKQPQGNHDSYNIGDKVLFNNEIYVSTVNGNVWQPTVYGWEKEE